MDDAHRGRGTWPRLVGARRPVVGVSMVATALPRASCLGWAEEAAEGAAAGPTTDLSRRDHDLADGKVEALGLRATASLKIRATSSTAPWREPRAEARGWREDRRWTFADQVQGDDQARVSRWTSPMMGATATRAASLPTRDASGKGKKDLSSAGTALGPKLMELILLWALQVQFLPSLCSFSDRALVAS